MMKIELIRTAIIIVVLLLQLLLYRSDEAVIRLIERHFSTDVKKSQTEKTVNKTVAVNLTKMSLKNK